MDIFDVRVAEARKELVVSDRITIQNGDANKQPRFEVWHWGFSLCSQKVRTVLTEKGIAYRSNELSFKDFENYNPGYVRLRLLAAGQEKLSRLAQKHTMRTSVPTEGFDACVVPLLVDHEKRTAIIDSAEIIEYIDREISDNPLIPVKPDLAQAVRKQIVVNDEIPHPGILYGFHKNDPRPDFYIEIMQNIYDRKRVALEAVIEKNNDDVELLRVYHAKIVKEAEGKKLQKDPSYMAGILDEFRKLISNLGQELSKQGEPWVCGSDYTMADCLWAISLYRIQWLGHGYLWKELPTVHDYAYRLYSRPSNRKAFIEWPTPMPPSPHTIDVDTV